MRGFLFAVALLCLLAPTPTLAQARAELLQVTDAASAVTAGAGDDARAAGMVVGGMLGGLVGAGITVGCLWMSGMAAPAMLPVCVIPLAAGIAFGIWAGASLANQNGGG